MQRHTENEINAAAGRARDEEAAKHTIKDSVFTNLFRDRKYLFQLYRALHPEDMDATADDLTDITIHNILTNDIYNDVGFMVGQRLMILTEAQSSWTVNIVVRILIYLMVTYQDYIKMTKQNVYGSKKVQLPKPELYLIYTGSRKEHLEYISLSGEFFDGAGDFLDARVKVLCGGGGDDIISQYVTFTKVYSEQMARYGRTRRAIAETIRICEDKNVLKEYLVNREKEVASIMLAMYDEKQILLDYIEYERHEAAKEAAKEAAEEATEKATKETSAATAIQMLKTGKLTVEEIVQCVPALTIDDIKKLQEKLRT